MVNASANLTHFLSTYITAAHILHFNGVLDAYGHVSVRNPSNSSTFFMSRQLAPALVSDLDDIVEYRVSDGEALDPNAPLGFLERYIHSEIFKRFSGINAVIHSHSPIVTAFSISRVPLGPAIHLAGFLGVEVPVFDITRYYNGSDVEDLLVRNVRLGAALAREFGSPRHGKPDHYVVLMQSHGFATAAQDLKTAVFQAVYTQNDAAVQSDAMQINSASHAAGDGPREGIIYLTERQARESWETDIVTIEKPWALWKREVQVSPLYINNLE